MFGRVKSKRENDIITGMALGRHRPKQPTTTLDRNLLAGIIPNKWRSIPIFPLSLLSFPVILRYSLSLLLPLHFFTRGDPTRPTPFFLHLTW
jgi:hypothetical protein